MVKQRTMNNQLGQQTDKTNPIYGEPVEPTKPNKANFLDIGGQANHSRGQPCHTNHKSQYFCQFEAAVWYNSQLYTLRYYG